MNYSPKVARVLTAEGISEAEFQRMVRQSALFTCEDGTRRFHDWIFDIRGDMCHNMVMYPVPSLNTPTKNGFVYEEHEPCNGDGCLQCNWVGRVARYF